MAFSSSVDFDAGDLEILEAVESLLLLKISAPEEKKRSVPQDRFLPWSFAKLERSFRTDGDAPRPTKLAKLSPRTPLSFSSSTSSDENPLPPPPATLPPLPPRRKTMSDEEHAKWTQALELLQQQLPKRINGGRRTFPAGPNFSSESIRRSTEKSRSQEIEWYASCPKMQRLG